MISTSITFSTNGGTRGGYIPPLPQWHSGEQTGTGLIFYWPPPTRVLRSVPITAAEPRQRRRDGSLVLDAVQAAQLAPPPSPTRAPVPRAHDRRMGFADAPRRPCYRAPRRAP